MTTCFEGSSIALQISSEGSLALNAPVGHLFIHCPQLIQITSANGLSIKVPTCVSCPRLIASSTPTSCKSIQVLMQRLQRTHLFISLTSANDDRSTGYLGSSTCPKTKLSSPYSFASFCSSQF